MLRDGKYAAWFRTPLGQGTGIVHLAGGGISGCDSFFTYGGSYRVDQDGFTGVLTTRRHADGMPTVFGLDEVEVDLAGTCSGMIATCSGRARQVPDVLLEVTLIYSQDDTPAPELNADVVRLKTDKLPRGLDSRSRSRPPIGAGPTKSPAS